MLNTASWVAGGKEALIKMKASENVQHQFREFRFSVQGPDGTELELKPKLHQFLSTDIVNTFYVVFAAENNSNNIFATSNQINVIEPYSLAENEYLARVTVSNHGKLAIFSGPTSLFEVANAGHYTWASYQPDSSGADPAIHVQFSADKDPGKITKVKVTARYKRADLLSYNGFTKAIEGATVLEVPLTMDVSHKDEESGKVYVNISATGSEAQKADVVAGVQESKDYTDEKLKELLDSLYPPVNGTTTLTVYASGDKTWWHFNSLEIYLASGQRLYPLYYENVNSATASTGGDNKIKLVLTKDTSATLTLQPSTFFDSYELKDGEYLGNLILAEAFGQTTTQSNVASSNIFSTDNHGLYVVPTASESAAFGIEITGELQQIAKISLRSPRQSSYVPPKIRATCVFDDTTLNAPEVETNSDTSATFVLPFAEESESEDIDLSNYVTLDGAESITGVKTFAATPVITNAPAADTDAVNKAYVDQAIQDAALEGEEIDTSKLVTTDTAQSITGAKSFTAPVTVATPTAGTHAATKDYVDEAVEQAVGDIDTSNLVTLDGAQTITGVKTFSAAPLITNAPVEDNEAANKAYVDSTISQKIDESLEQGGGSGSVSEDASILSQLFASSSPFINSISFCNLCSRSNTDSSPSLDNDSAKGSNVAFRLSDLLFQYYQPRTNYSGASNAKTISYVLAVTTPIIYLANSSGLVNGTFRNDLLAYGANCVQYVLLFRNTSGKTITPVSMSLKDLNDWVLKGGAKKLGIDDSSTQNWFLDNFILCRISLKDFYPCSDLTSTIVTQDPNVKLSDIFSSEGLTFKSVYDGGYVSNSYRYFNLSQTNQITNFSSFTGNFASINIDLLHNDLMPFSGISAKVSGARSYMSKKSTITTLGDLICRYNNSIYSTIFDISTETFTSNFTSSLSAPAEATTLKFVNYYSPLEGFYNMALLKNYIANLDTRLKELESKS